VAGQFEANRAQIRVRRDDEIVFQAVLFAMKHQVDAG
jgi:hypothetical protein